MEPRTQINKAARRHSNERLGRRLSKFNVRQQRKRKLSRFEHLGDGAFQLEKWAVNGER